MIFFPKKFKYFWEKNKNVKSYAKNIAFDAYIGMHIINDHIMHKYIHI